MAAADRIHDAVKNALVKDGWTITDDPFTIDYEEIKLFADLGLERPLGARRGERKLVVETKSFIGQSPMQDFKLALGQFLLYRALLEVAYPDYEIYMAIDSDAFAGFFQQKAIQLVCRRYQITLVVIDVTKEEVSKWIS